MNSWNRSTSYANNVKLYRLDLPKELKEKAWDFFEVDLSDFNFDVEYLIDEFRGETGYDAAFNGSSGGYLVMYDAEWDYSREHPVLITYQGRSIDDDDPEYFEDWGMESLRERVQLVSRFDELCDNIRDTFIYYLENYEVVEEEYTVVKTRKVLREV
jgi:hypothetical protein